jgi:ABC-type sugar transport system ATPase subunit
MLELKDIRKRLGGQEVLRGVNLKVAPAEKVVVIGRSGCGKSVMLRHVMGLLQPDGGEVFFEGKKLTGLGEEAWNPFRRKIGMLFQGAALFDSLSVFENLAFPLREEGEKDEKVLRDKVAEMSPRAARVLEQKRAWQEAAPAVDPSQGPLQFLLAVQEPTASTDVTLMEMEFTPKQVMLRGHTLNASTALQYSQEIHQSEMLMAFDWGEPSPPELAADESATFELKGVRP